VRVLAGFGNELWAAADSVLYNGYAHSPTLVASGRIDVGEHGLPMALAATRDAVWLATRDTLGTERLLLLARRANRVSVSRSTEIDQPIGLANWGPQTVLTFTVRPPFIVSLRDNRLTERAIAYLNVPKRNDDAGSFWLQQAAIPLDCDRVLVVQADLRSDRRNYVTLQRSGRGFEEIHSTTLTGPLVLSSSIAADGTLAGFSDVPGARALVLYKWQWLDRSSTQMEVPR
jgi:hypothetical protein